MCVSFPFVSWHLLAQELATKNKENIELLFNYYLNLSVYFITGEIKSSISTSCLLTAQMMVAFIVCSCILSPNFHSWASRPAERTLQGRLFNYRHSLQLTIVKINSFKYPVMAFWYSSAVPSWVCHQNTLHLRLGSDFISTSSSWGQTNKS